MCKGLVVVYRSQDDTTFFVVGSDDENEVILVRHLTRAAVRTARGLPLGMSCSLINARGCFLLHAYYLRPTTNKCGRWESVVRC
jgi:hypothetical protein